MNIKSFVAASSASVRTKCNLHVGSNSQTHRFTTSSELISDEKLQKSKVVSIQKTHVFGIVFGLFFLFKPLFFEQTENTSKLNF